MDKRTRFVQEASPRSLRRATPSASIDAAQGSYMLNGHASKFHRLVEIPMVDL